MKIIEKRLNRDEKSNTGKQLDEYITTWTQYQLLRKQKTQQGIDLEEKENARMLEKTEALSN